MQFLLALLVLSTAHLAHGYVDSSGYESFGGSKSSYRLHSERVIWDTAAKICSLEGAHLIVIDSEDEAILTSLLFARLPAYNPPMAWGFDLLHVGITDRKEEGNWLTILGESVAKKGYKKWRKGEPDNDESAEHCGAIDRIGQFSDIRCNYDLGHLCAFICEKEISDKDFLGEVVTKPSSNDEYDVER